MLKVQFHLPLAMFQVIQLKQDGQMPQLKLRHGKKHKVIQSGQVRHYLKTQEVELLVPAWKIFG